MNFFSLNKDHHLLSLLFLRLLFEPFPFVFPRKIEALGKDHPCIKTTLFNSSPFLRSPTGCGGRSVSLWVHRNISRQLSTDENVHGSGMSHATTASPKPSFKAPWKVDDTVVGRENAGWTTSKSGHPCPCQNCSQGPPAEKTGRVSLLNRPSCPPDDFS